MLRSYDELIRPYKMKIFFIISFIIFTIFIIGKKVFYSAKRNLFKDQEAWSGKDIKIKYSSPKEALESKGNKNYLKIIAEESNIYLEDQYKKKQTED